MKAVFEVKTIEADWAPPFRKNITNETFSVTENEAFDRIVGNGNDESVFTLLKIGGDSATITYSTLFTLKGRNQPQDKSIKMHKNSEESFSYLWGEKGITKKIIYKGIEVPAYEEATETQETVSEPMQEIEKTNAETTEASMEEEHTEIYAPIKDTVTNNETPF